MSGLGTKSDVKQKWMDASEVSESTKSETAKSLVCDSSLICDKIKIVVSSIKMYQKMIQETTDKKLYENLSKNLEKELNNLKKLQELYPEYFI